MAFHVELSDIALDDLKNIYWFVEGATSQKGRIWFEKLQAAIKRLDEMPERGSIVAEDGRFRQLLYGRKPHLYRIIYRFDARASVVSVAHIRHAARDAWLSGSESGK